MTVLVTGAGGLLGRHTVEALLRRGNEVRVLLRPAANLAALPWADRVDVVRADLRAREVPDELAAGVDRVIHLAASVTGDEDEMFAAGVVGTERLLAALERAPLERFVLASSMTVYDWSAADGVLTEQTPLEPDPYTRGGYTVAKLWQERLLRRAAEERDFELVVLRPGFVWGRDQPYVAGAALSAGPLHVSFAGGARVPLTYVENCADCFAHALEHPGAAGQTFNVVDDTGVPGADYFERYALAKGVRGARIRLPYRAVRRAIQLVDRAARAILGANARLPSAFHPAKFEARFKPLEFSTEKLRTTLGWRPPVAYDEALRRTFE